MPTYYFDIETTGLNPKKDKVIAIQWQELDKNTGKPVGELRILKEWESSEREIIGQFLKESRIADDYAFSFVPVGYNLTFEHNFLKERTAVHSFTPLDILNHPNIDFRPLGVLMNGGEFKGSGLDKLTGKPHDGRVIPEWYARKEYDKIVAYVKIEAASFTQLAQWLYKKMPIFLKQFKEENGVL